MTLAPDAPEGIYGCAERSATVPRFRGINRAEVPNPANARWPVKEGNKQ